MSDSKSADRITVIGASGNVGAATLRTFASDEYKAYNVVAGVRDPEAAAGKGLDKLAEHISLVKGSFGDKDGIKSASTDAKAVFIVSPGAEDRTALTIEAIDAAKEAGAKHIVLVSVLSVGEEDPNAVLFGKQFLPIENHLKESGTPYTNLRLPMFMDNNWGNAGSIKEQGAIYNPTKPTAVQTAIAVSDVAEAAAKILTNPSEHAGKTYTFTAAPFTNEDLAAAFSKSLDKEVKLVEVPFEAAYEALTGMGMPGWQVNGVFDLIRRINEGHALYTKQFDDAKTVLGREPTTIQQWVEANKAGFTA